MAWDMIFSFSEQTAALAVSFVGAVWTVYWLWRIWQDHKKKREGG